MSDRRASAPRRSGAPAPLRVAYIVNRYPFVSHTFIRREILALERRGVDVVRITFRHGDVAGDEDRVERDRTKAVLRRGWLGPVAIAVATAVRRPRRFAAAAGLARRLRRGTGRHPAVHASYVVQACVVARWVRRLDVHHLHAHFGTNSADVAALVGVLADVPYSVTIHGPDEFDRPATLNIAEKVRNAAFVVAISSYGRSQIYRWIDHGEWPKVHVVRCGVDGEFRDVARTDPPANRRLACIGRLSEQKGQELLVMAVAALRDRGIDVEVVLVGDGELRDDIERLITRLSVADRVRITGWQSSTEVRSTLLESRALVLASFAEGLPVVLMEAMALGRPALSTYVAGIPELLEDGESGWLFTPGDVDALARAIARCLDTAPEALAAMGERARTRVLAAHDVDEEVGHLIELFGGAGGRDRH